MATPAPVGQILRSWRERRRLSQLELALRAEVSARHVSFLETGRAVPSREMILRLAERLDIPLRSRNALLLAAGLAPEYEGRSLDHPAMADAHRAVEWILKGHEPFPAIAVDRHWTLVAANAAVGPLLAGIPEQLLNPPLNVLRVSLHPEGLASRIGNLTQWRDHLLRRLHQQIEQSGDPVLGVLASELADFPVPDDPGEVTLPDGYAGIAVPLCLRVGNTALSFVSTTTVFGTPVDITLAELAIESFFPADEATYLRLVGERKTGEGQSGRSES